MTRGRGDWILGLIQRTLRLFSLEPQSRSSLLSVGVDHLVDVDPGGAVVVLTVHSGEREDWGRRYPRWCPDVVPLSTLLN